jgi:medium-chain acyl-[acyl-carrier-protein] hydrolase
VRLFCFAHAGGGAAFFFPWREALAPGVDVRPILLPGRESRVREPPARQVEELLEPLCVALAGYLDLPYALFGHSTGAVVAYEAARRLTATASRPPALLIVSGRRAPGLPNSRRCFSELPDAELRRALRDLNGTPDALLEHPELLAAMLPTLRADLELNERYRPLAGERLECPVFGYLGAADRHVGHAEVVAWQRTTTGRFRARCFEGDHFYLKGTPPHFLHALAADLADVLSDVK